MKKMWKEIFIWSGALVTVALFLSFVWVTVTTAPSTAPKTGGTEMTVESQLNDVTVYRTRVPNGWLYITRANGYSPTSSFVPDMVTVIGVK